MVSRNFGATVTIKERSCFLILPETRDDNQQGKSDGMTAHIFIHSKTVRRVQEHLANPDSDFHFKDPRLYEGWLCFHRVKNMLTIPFRGNRLWRDEHDVYYRIAPVETDTDTMLFTSHNGSWYTDCELYRSR